MQQIFEKNAAFSQHETEFYASPNYHVHYNNHSNELQSISPQQSSTSDVDEISMVNNQRTDSTLNKSLKKKKQTKKKRKDPNEPQKPVSPYALFFRDTQNDIKKKLINPSFGEISKVVAHMWENIEPELKEQYKHRAAAAKKEYLKQLAAYRAVQVSHQIPTMSHILNQTALTFPNNIVGSKSFSSSSSMISDRNSHSHHQQYPSSSTTTTTTSSSQGHVHQAQIHYPTHSYSNESNMYFGNHSQPMYSSYETNNNSHYGLMRSNGDFEHYQPYYSSVNDEQLYSYQHPLNETNRNQIFFTPTASASASMQHEADAHWNSNSQW